MVLHEPYKELKHGQIESNRSVGMNHSSLHEPYKELKPHPRYLHELQSYITWTL